jgi:hypothetical protein
MSDFSVEELVREAVQQYEKESELAVSPVAVAALMSRGQEHEEQTRKDLETGHATIPFLHGVLLEILRRAGTIARSEQHSAIDLAALELAIKEDCPYPAWRTGDSS